MKCPKTVLLFLTLCLWKFSLAQTATITGVVLDENNIPLTDVNVRSDLRGTYTDKTGFYTLRIISEQKVNITFSHIGHENVVLKNLILSSNETFEFNPVLKEGMTQVDGVTVTASGEKRVVGITTISPAVIRRIPGANAGVENVLKLLPGVNSNNELSTQYSVRGGNYDENLVYVNGIEVYRPFLIRSGQQEGLSFINPDMVQKIDFSPGGFQAEYGDKLSSVLDITYKTPSEFSLQANASLLGLSSTLETISKDKDLSTITGVRYRNNSLLVNSQQTESNFNPTFADIQSFLNYRISDKIKLGILGAFSLNDYQNEPLTRQTNFGTLNDPKALLVFYQGRENNRFQTAQGAIMSSYQPNDQLDISVTTSLYHTTEEEYSDVFANYELGSVDTDLGSDNAGGAIATRGIGSQFNRARNDLDALIFNIAHRGSYSKNSSLLEWGATYSHEDIRDQLRESEFLDSLGFSVRPPGQEFINNQPNSSFDGPIVPYEGVSAQNFIKTNRYSAFTQFGRKLEWLEQNIYYNLGIRAQYWTVNGKNVERSAHTIISPRGQFSIKPNWDLDMLFTLSGGLYQQPPMYRELRNKEGEVYTDVKAQKSVHTVLGNEYSFILWGRPFTLQSEIYYKKLNSVNPYTLDDVRIRYAATNNAKAYAYGAEIRMNGAFVPGTESWVSIGYLKTEENINDRGFISRPTDQRLKFGVLFQDYVPDIPNLRMYLNLVYNTGVPGGSPSYADPYNFQNRLRDYRRADLGISHIFVDANTTYPKNHWLHGFKELNIGFEIFNLFNNQNSITNTWVRDVDSKQEFAVPNFMTTRVLNLKIGTRF
ncbi:TonB-dependent receptor plug domain-containing protein [Flavobacteriaceae bacterium KMM 6897]|nr:TonB-dependent receptor plug domain-containing protein [Flavobacteriaceae bacterium KMM 6897]